VQEAWLQRAELLNYAWKAKFGGMNVSDAQRLKALEAENTKLKKLRESGGRGGATRGGAAVAGAWTERTPGPEAGGH